MTHDTYDIPVYSLWINRNGTMFKLGFAFNHADALALLEYSHDGGIIKEYTIDFLPKQFGYCKLHRMGHPKYNCRHKIYVPSNENTCTVCTSGNWGTRCCAECSEFVPYSLMPIKKEMLISA